MVTHTEVFEDIGDTMTKSEDEPGAPVICSVLLALC